MSDTWKALQTVSLVVFIPPFGCSFSDVVPFSLSRKDALKRHIAVVHEIFIILFGHDLFDILKPKRKDQHEDLELLIVLCLTVQMQAQRCGKEIKPTQDLIPLYPQIVALMNRS